MRFEKFVFKIRNLFFFLFGEKFSKKLKYNWGNFPTRVTVVNYLIKKNNFRSYLEIGCDKDYLFSKVIIKKKIGVDPKSGGTARMTSDTFFLKNKKTFDIIFIDGLHIYDQVKRDVLNSIKVLNKNGLILLHDCLPRKISEQHVPRMRNLWTGDVWKVIVDLRTNKNLDTYTLIADMGIGIVLKRKNRNLLKLDKEFKKLNFKDYFYNHKKFMNLISYSKLINLF